MERDNQPYIFISYSHADAPFAALLSGRLRAAGIEHFRDTEVIDWGEDIPDRIHEALDRATHLLVLISPGSEKSAWVAYEMGYARGRRIVLVPYILHPSMTLPGFIASTKYLQNLQEEAEFIRRLRRTMLRRTRVVRTQHDVSADISKASRLLRSQNPEARRQAIDQLVGMKAHRPVLEALVSNRVEVRLSAAAAAGRMRLAQALPYLVAGLESTGLKRRQPVIPDVENVVASFGLAAVTELLRQVPDTPGCRVDASRWVTALSGAIDSDSVLGLIAALKDTHRRLLLQAILRSSIRLERETIRPIVLDYASGTYEQETVAEWLLDSQMRDEDWVHELVKKWLSEQCVGTSVSSDYFSRQESLTRRALRNKAVTTDDVLDILAESPNKKMGERLRLVVAEFDPFGTPSTAQNSSPLPLGARLNAQIPSERVDELHRIVDANSISHIPAVIALLRLEHIDEVRAGAIDALTRMRHETAVAGIEEIWHSTETNPQDKDRAALALQSLGLWCADGPLLNPLQVDMIFRSLTALKETTDGQRNRDKHDLLEELEGTHRALLLNSGFEFDEIAASSRSVSVTGLKVSWTISKLPQQWYHRIQHRAEVSQIDLVEKLSKLIGWDPGWSDGGSVATSDAVNIRSLVSRCSHRRLSIESVTDEVIEVSGTHWPCAEGKQLKIAISRSDPGSTVTINYVPSDIVNSWMGLVRLLIRASRWLQRTVIHETNEPTE